MRSSGTAGFPFSLSFWAEADEPAAHSRVSANRVVNHAFIGILRRVGGSRAGSARRACGGAGDVETLYQMCGALSRKIGSPAAPFPGAESVEAGRDPRGTSREGRPVVGPVLPGYN